jgi:hypothetical protein
MLTIKIPICWATSVPLASKLDTISTFEWLNPEGNKLSITEYEI